jgi:hypothetical protein
MSSIGPKNPPPGALPTPQPTQAEDLAGRLDAAVESLRQSGEVEAKDEEREDEVEEHEGEASSKRAKLLGQARRVMPTPAPKKGAGVMNLRLGALTGQGFGAGDKLGRGGRVRSSDHDRGRVVEGDVLVHTADDLKALAGVTVLKGNLEILESAVSAADLNVLRGLRSLEGNLVLEGNRAVESLEALSALERVDGNLYAGHNEALTALSLPTLKQLGGALILEGNLRMSTVDLPALEAVGGYLHLHENDELSEARFGALSSIDRELSILDNPKLVLVAMPALSAHDDVEIEANGRDQLDGLNLAH